MDAQYFDRLLICSDCRGEFTFTAGEQLFFYERQFKHDPKRCKPCKSRRSGLAAVANSRDRCRLFRCAPRPAPNARSAGWTLRFPSDLRKGAPSYAGGASRREAESPPMFRFSSGLRRQVMLWRSRRRRWRVDVA